MSIQRFHTSQRMSQVVTVDPGAKLVLLSGQVAENRAADTETQTRDVLDRIDALLSEAGANKEDVVSAWIWLANISEFDVMNRVWDAWVPSGRAPVRATVEATLAAPDIRVEIQVIAAVAAA